jgi:hypothetical protein
VVTSMIEDAKAFSLRQERAEKSLQLQECHQE